MSNTLRVVNGVNINTYELDTPITFTQRIASEFNILPIYIYFPNGEDQFYKKRVILFENLLDKIQRYKLIDYRTLLDELRPKFPKNINIDRDVIYVWLAYNKKLNKIVGSNQFDTLVTNLIEDGYFSSRINFENFLANKRNQIKQELQDKINLNKQVVKIQEQLYTTLANVEEGWGSTDISIERVILDIRLDLPDTSILEMFNYLILHQGVPFAVSKNYYKILKDFVPAEDWSISDDHTLLLKVNQKEIIDPEKYNEYSDVIIRLEDEKLYANMKLYITRENLDRNKFITRFLQTFNFQDDVKYDDVTETEVAAIFYFPMERINPYIMSDLIMNDHLFSYLLSSDESSRATKRLSESGIPLLYIHFEHPITGHITATIAQKTVTNNDKNVKDMDPEIFPLGSSYIRVRVKGRDRQSLEKFQDIFSKLMVVYEEKHNEIQEIYREYISDFGDIEEEEQTVDPTKLKNVVPDLFISNYTRNNCKTKNMPIIVNTKQATKLAKQNVQVMKFPRDEPTTGIKYPSDGKNQHYYACLGKENKEVEYPFPGLQTNKLSNTGLYPYVPCCFKNDQTNKKLYQHYYSGKELTKPTKTKVQQNMIKTDKILDATKFGELPNEITKIFRLLDPDENYRYLRLGMDRNHSSFLNCVMTSLYEETKFLELQDEDERFGELDRIRQEMGALDFAPVCRQSMYDVTSDIASKYIKDSENYLNPSLYLQLLEQRFNCNIFLFNRERLILPRYLQSYFTDKRVGRSCVFVYEHWGSESDHAVYPQCELITRWRTKTKTEHQYVFPYSQKISRGIRTMFALLRQSYILNDPNDQTIFDLNSRMISQTIDSYGKCRKLEIKTENNLLTLFTPPIAPRETKEIDSDIHTVNIGVAERFLNKQGNLTGQTVINGVAKELIGLIGNVVVSIPVNDSLPLENLPSRDRLSYSENKVSMITTYNNNKKLARYLVEYCYWLFSKFLAKKKIEVVSDDVLVQFAKSKILVDPTFTYGEVRKTFSRDSGLMVNKKLVVQSEEALRRLLYTLRLYSVRNIKGLTEYRNKNVIQHYYQDITDFDRYPNQTILLGTESVEKWINEGHNQQGKFSYRLYDHVVPGTRFPYFFKNNLVNNNIYLAQNIDTIPKALSIAQTWQQQGYNETIYAGEQPDIGFIFYNYTSPDNIRPYKIRGSENTQHTIRVLGYKIDNTILYTVLLLL